MWLPGDDGMLVGILLGCVIGACVQFALTIYFDRKLNR